MAASVVTLIIVLYTKTLSKMKLKSLFGVNGIFDSFTAQKMAHFIKSAHSDLRQFLAAESPLRMIKNAFCFTSKALFVLKIFKFLSWLFGQVAKRLDKKDKANFEFYDVTTSFYAQFLKKNISLVIVY